MIRNILLIILKGIYYLFSKEKELIVFSEGYHEMYIDYEKDELGIGDWGWGLGIGPNPQSPIPNPQEYLKEKATPIILLLLSNYFINLMLQENHLPQWLVEEMISYLYTHELIIKSQDIKSVQHVPVSIFPSQVIYSYSVSKIVI